MLILDGSNLQSSVPSHKRHVLSDLGVTFVRGGPGQVLFGWGRVFVSDRLSLWAAEGRLSPEDPFPFAAPIQLPLASSS